MLGDGFGEYLKKLVIGIGRQMPEIEIIEVNTNMDHMHMLLFIPPKMSISEVVKEMKAKTGLYMRRKFSFLDKVLHWGQGGIWSRDYFVSTVGMDEVTIKKYNVSRCRAKKTVDKLCLNSKMPPVLTGGSLLFAVYL